MKKFIAYLSSLLLVGICFADSDLKWSHPQSQNGTYVMGAVLITNSTMTNATLAGTIVIGPSTLSNTTVTGWVNISGSLTNSGIIYAKTNVVVSGQLAVASPTALSGSTIVSNTLGVTSTATFNTNAIITGQLRTTITKAAGLLTNGPAFTTTLPADASTNTVIWVHMMSGTNHVVVPGFQVGTP